MSLSKYKKKKEFQRVHKSNNNKTFLEAIVLTTRDQHMFHLHCFLDVNCLSLCGVGLTVLIGPAKRTRGQTMTMLLSAIDPTDTRKTVHQKVNQHLLSEIKQVQHTNIKSCQWILWTGQSTVLDRKLWGYCQLFMWWNPSNDSKWLFSKVHFDFLEQRTSETFQNSNMPLRAEKRTGLDFLSAPSGEWRTSTGRPSCQVKLNCSRSKKRCAELIATQVTQLEGNLKAKSKCLCLQ